MSKTNHPIILFDGVCNLCNSSVQFVINHDKKNQFRFASLQSTIGEKLLVQHHLNTNNYNSFILIDEGKAYTRSTAALKVAQKLSSPWTLLYIFIIVPPFIRNAVYDLIARNRYKWFGKKDSCMIPSPDLLSKFLH